MREKSTAERGCADPQFQVPAEIAPGEAGVLKVVDFDVLTLGVSKEQEVAVADATILVLLEVRLVLAEDLIRGRERERGQEKSTDKNTKRE